MGKPKSGKTYTSKGIHSNVAKKTLNAMRRDNPNKIVNIMAAYWAGKNPWITIENPNKEETNKKFVRVKTNTLYGNPKDRHSYVQTKAV